MKKRCISFIRKSIIAVFCTFTAFSHCLFGYASNDDEYITFNTPEMMQAYNYFKLYGLTADTSYTYTDTYSTTGSINLGNVNISLSSNGSIGGSGTSVSSFEGMWHSFVGTGEDTYTLDISNSTVAHMDPTSTTASHLTLACTFNTTSGGYLTGGTCSDPSYVDVSRYNITLNAVNDVVTISGSRADTYAIFRSTANPNYDAETNSDLSMYSADSFTGSLNFNSSGGLSGSGIISATTTTTNINNLKYILPEMSLSNLSNPSNPASGIYCFRLFSNDHYIIAFITNSGKSKNNMNLRDYNSSTYLNFDDYFTWTGKNITGDILYIIESKDVNKQLFSVFDYNQNFFSGKIIPLYVGYKNNMSDEMYRYLYGSDRLIEAVINQTNIIETGNNNSQQKEQALNTQTTQMQNQMTQFQNIEDTAGNNMNTALNNINTNPSLLSTNKFLVSVDWVRQQYNRIVTNTPFEAVITFCLVFGLGLLLLGKVR